MSDPNIPIKVVDTNGVQTVFPFEFFIFTGSNIQCFFSPNGVAPLVPITGFTVSIATPPQVGGSVNFSVAPANGGVLVILRILPYTYSTSFAKPETFNGKSLDIALQNQEMQIQQLAFITSNYSIRYSESTPPAVIADLSIVPVLQENQVWTRVGDAMIGVTIDTSSSSLLRSELASEVEDGDGALLVGYYDTKTSSGMTVKTKLDNLTSEQPLSEVFIGDKKFSEQASDHGYWLLEDGRAVSRTTYAAYNTRLEALGYPYGDGDGTTTFNLRNATGRVNLGAGIGYSLSSQGGSDTVSLVEANNGPHFHTVVNASGNPIKRPTVFGAGGLGALDTGVLGDDEALKTGPSGAGTPFSILNPYTALNSFVYVGPPAA